MKPDTLAVLGLGAIGGSAAWQARLAGVHHVIGWSPERTEPVQALQAGALSEIADSAEAAVRGADLVLLATPPGATIELIGRLASHLGSGAIVTDVASVKGPVIARAREVGLTACFAGGHPMAGTHEWGWSAARADRLRGALVYITPTDPIAGEHAARQVIGFWREVLEAEPVLIDAETHDRRLAWTSHLPQAVASALAVTLADCGLNSVDFGAGARDTLRLAASQSALWADILLQNRGPVDTALEGLEGSLARLRALIAAGDAAGLLQFLEKGSDFRRGLGS